MNCCNNSNIGESSLTQGTDYNKYRDYQENVIKPDLIKLQDPGLGKLDTVIESMDVIRPHTNAYSRSKNEISNLEDKFSKVLAKYKATYKLFAESLINNKKADQNIKKYFNKIVTTTDGNYSYVNNYGYTHKFSTDAWSNKVNSCSSNPIEVNDTDYNKFKQGPNMGIKQPCGIAGTNIKNIETNEHAWVDIKGYKHIYSDDLWNKKSADCDIPVTLLTNGRYNSIPQGNNMTKTDNCLMVDVDPNLWSELVKLNYELNVLSKQISKELKSLVKTDINLDSALKDMQDKFENDMTEYKQQNEEIKKYDSSIVTIEGEQESSHLTMKMYSMHKVVWTILLIVVLALTFHAFMTPNSKTGDIIGLIFAIILLFIITKWLWRKYNY